MTGESAIGHTREDLMTDPHQVNLIIANAICDAHKDHEENRMNPEEAKQIAKCIIEALSDAGLEIVPAGKIDASARAGA